MSNKLIEIIAIIVCLYLSGCTASGPRFSQINTPPDQMSQIYIYRPWAYTSGGVGLPIIHNGEQLPYPLRNQGYLNYFAQAGHHKMHVNSQGTVDRVLEFDSKAGQTYFVKLTIQNYFAVMGTKLSLVEKETALKEIKKCNLSTTGNSIEASTQEDVPIMGDTAKSVPYPTNSTEGKNILIADEIRKLSELKDDGIITEEEFKHQKSKILNQ